jgi:hypothetical protein
VVIYAATEGSDARRYLLAFGCRTGIFLNALTREFLFFLFGMDGWMASRDAGMSAYRVNLFTTKSIDFMGAGFTRSYM